MTNNAIPQIRILPSQGRDTLFHLIQNHVIFAQNVEAAIDYVNGFGGVAMVGTTESKSEMTYRQWGIVCF